MTQVSRYRLSENIKKQIDDFFFETLANLSTKKQVEEFLVEFLTKNERIMFTKRLAIGILIARGYDYREISRTLKVSTTTVGSFASLYKFGTNYTKIVNGIESKLKNKKFILGVAEDFANMGAIGGAKSAGWFTTRNEVRKKKQDIL